MHWNLRKEHGAYRGDKDFGKTTEKTIVQVIRKIEDTGFLLAAYRLFWRTRT
jgi:hypothetical protein